MKLSPNTWGHIGYVLIAIGMILLAKQIIWGWLVRFLGELVWLFVGIKLKMDSIYAWTPIFLVMELYGFYAWWVSGVL